MPVYLITYSILFWVPAVIFALFFLKMFDPALRKSFWTTSGVMAVVLVGMEYVFLKFDVWFFSEKIDHLVGLWIGKAPVEEFVFWFGATPFCLAVYLCYSKFLKKNA